MPSVASASASAGPKTAAQPVDLGLDGGAVEAVLGQDDQRQVVGHPVQREQQVLDADGVRMLLAGLLLREDHDLAGVVGEPFEHLLLLPL